MNAEMLGELHISLAIHRRQKCLETIMLFKKIMTVSESTSTERRCRVVNTPGSYSGGSGFKSWPGDLLS
jgi:hypothetical protein